MYIEDNKDVNRINMQLFSDLFYEVDLAEDGLSAMKLYKDNSYDLIIADLNIPKMSGIELIEIIKKINSDQMIMVITAYDESEYIDLLKDLDVKYILKKPVKYKKLLTTICECLGDMVCV
jgi:CheY-like chemotaxis protein